MMLIPAVLLAAACLTLVLSLLGHWYWCKSNRTRSLTGAKRVLLVIAHPDDECMFFGPSIQGLVAQGCDVFVLCLSSGNYRKLGLIRKAELRNSCVTMGVKNSWVMVTEHSKLPDDPYLLWNRQILRGIILRTIEQLGVDTVISFDEWGVSGHRNHAAIFRALQSLYTQGNFPVNMQVFTLESVNLFRKYSSFLDVIPSRFSSTFSYIATWHQLAQAQRAMRCHASQLVWFRRLYILFSRYMIVNTFRRIRLDELFYNDPYTPSNNNNKKHI